MVETSVPTVGLAASFASLLGLREGSVVTLEPIDQAPPALSCVFLEPFDENEWEIMVN